MFRWLFERKYPYCASYNRALKELELAVEASKTAVLPSEERAADKAMDDALRRIRTVALLKSDSFGF